MPRNHADDVNECIYVQPQLFLNNFLCFVYFASRIIIVYLYKDDKAKELSRIHMNVMEAIYISKLIMMNMFMRRTVWALHSDYFRVTPGLNRLVVFLKWVEYLSYIVRTPISRVPSWTRQSFLAWIMRKWLVCNWMNIIFRNTHTYQQIYVIRKRLEK